MNKKEKNKKPINSKKKAKYLKKNASYYKSTICLNSFNSGCFFEIYNGLFLTLLTNVGRNEVIH